MPMSCPPSRLVRLVRLVLLACALVVSAPLSASAQWQRLNKSVWSRVLEHEDGTRTDSKQDINTKVLEEMTFDQNGVRVKRRIFQLDDLARPRTGLLFDGRNNLLARTEYVYDEYDELKEERLFNTKGQILRRLVYGLARDGIQSRPIAFTYDPSRPDASPVRSTTNVDPVMPLDVKKSGGSAIPVAGATSSGGGIPSGSAPPARGDASTESGKGSATGEKKKKGFLWFRRK